MVQSREVFSALTGPETTPGDHADAVTTRRWIEVAVGDEVDALIGAAPLREVLVDLCGRSHERLSVYAGAVADLLAGDLHPCERESLRRRALLDLAPHALTSGYLLHAMTGPWNCESAHGLSCLRMHAGDVGVGQPRSSRAEAYVDLMRANGLADAGVDLTRTAADPRISEGAFDLPAVLMQLAHLPESLAGAVLGANLYLRDVGRLPVAALVTSTDAPAWSSLHLGDDPLRGPGAAREDAWLATLQLVAAGDGAIERDVLLGFCVCRREVESLHEGLLTVARAWLDPREAAAALIRERRREAAVHDGTATLDGTSLQEWFTPDRDPFEVLDALARSRWVRPGVPERSPLLQGLISLRASMNRVFTSDDVEVLSRWVEALPELGPLPPDHVPARHRWPGLELPGASAASPHDHDQVDGLRDAYRRLLHRELTAAESHFATSYVEGWLARCGRDVKHCPLPQAWSPGRLRPWLHAQHERQDAALGLARPDLVGEEELIREAVGLAPLTLIDGAWLTGHTHPAMASTPSGYTLFEAFWDELGNGVHAENHPVVYRALIDRMRGPLPATAAAEFSGSGVFDDEHFALPVYWLALGRSPKRYQPEILGLNLAMELSGVGGGYQATHAALERHGYPTLFVDLHHATDDVSTGHSAWAADSIDSYMSGQSAPDRERIWHRVRLGFCTLTPPTDTRSRMRERSARRKAAAL